MARTAHRETGCRDLCMAGGVALNCVANGRLLREGPFERLWVQPAAGDAGGALGAAQLAWHRAHGAPRRVARHADGSACDAMRGAYLGPAYGAPAIEAVLRELGARHVRLADDELAPRVAALLADGAVVGWFSGRMEFGPRALGGRSILGDPRDPGMQSRMNQKIKFREDFRPFAPSVLAERAADWFALDVPSPYMLLVADVRGDRRVPVDPARERDLRGLDRLALPRSVIPAVTHVDGSARVQTVHAETHPAFHALLAAFEARTGCPVLVNTSFNVRGEPVVCTPLDAYRCFMRTDIDHLVLGPYLLDKREQPPWREAPDAWRAAMPLD
jgi:carbamoyltransferase